MDDDSIPDWWIANQQIRDELELPEYDAPKFADGNYTHTVIDDLETKYECNIRLIGINTQYGDNWEIRVDGETIGLIGRYRNDKGNTIYEMTSSTFRQLVSDSIDNCGL